MITARLVRGKGHDAVPTTTGTAGGGAPVATDARVMEFIIASTYTAEMITARSAYLAGDMIDLAVAWKEIPKSSGRSSTDAASAAVARPRNCTCPCSSGFCARSRRAARCWTGIHTRVSVRYWSSLGDRKSVV